MSTFKADNQTSDEKKSSKPAFNSFKVIMKVANKRRPYTKADFVKEYFIPDI